jgi:predicted secreted protein
MRRRACTLVALTTILGLTAALSGCWSGEVTVTQEDAGTIRVARVGDRVTIRLDGNPSTGHAWTRQAPPSDELAGSALQPIEEGTWEFPSGGQVPGEAGVCLFRYLADQPGSVAFSFAYGRSWEPEPVQTFSVVIRVLD